MNKKKMKVGVGDFLFLFGITIFLLALEAENYFLSIALGILAIYCLFFALYISYKYKETDGIIINFKNKKRNSC